MAKKDFKINNPALTFITLPEEPLHQEPLKKEVPMMLRPEYREVKSRRVQLLLQPSVVDEMKAIAKELGISMNEAISQALKEYIGQYKKGE